MSSADLHRDSKSNARNGGGALAALERVADSIGVPFDRLVAMRSLAEAGRTWPGDDRELWARRLLEVGESLGIRFKQIDASLEDVPELLREGAPVVTLAGTAPNTHWHMLTKASGKRVLHEKCKDEHPPKWISVHELAGRLGTKSTDAPIPWLVAQPTLVCDDAAEDDKTEPSTPFGRLIGLLRPERSDLSMVLLFAMVVGVLSLTTPIAVEALVNTVAFGRLLQPVIVLSILLLTFLGFRAALIAVQTYVVELLQRRLFIRVVADLAFRLPRAQRDALDGIYGPELANRFFDVVTLQKAVASLSLDAVAIILQTIIGMAVLAFYHPFMLGFDVFLLISIGVVIFAFGRNAVTTAVKESKSKYAIGAWLEELVRHPIAFRFFGGSEFALDKTDQLASDYLNARRKHFRIVLRQIVLALSLQVVGSTVLLGLGGWLVIKGQLTLGQLVAAELIVTAIVSSFAKLGKHVETFYDLLASVEKLGRLFDLPIESHDEYFHAHNDRPAALRLRNVAYRYPNGGRGIAGADFEVQSGERVALVGPSGCGKSTVLDLLFDMRQPTAGRIEFDGVDLKEIRCDSVRERVALVRDVEVFHGTLAENVHLHRPGISIEQVRQALTTVSLLDEIMAFPDGLEELLSSDAAPLTQSQARRLMVARAIVDQPRLLLVDGILDGLSDEEIGTLLPRLTDKACPWTLINSTGRARIAEKCDRVISLSNGARTAAVSSLTEAQT